MRGESKVGQTGNSKGSWGRAGSCFQGLLFVEDDNAHLVAVHGIRFDEGTVAEVIPGVDADDSSLVLEGEPESIGEVFAFAAGKDPVGLVLVVDAFRKFAVVSGLDPSEFLHLA